MSHAHVLPARAGVHAGSHRSPLGLDTTDRLHLLLALCCTLTGTPWGVAVAAVVLAVLAARRCARRSLERSVAVRRGVLAPAQRTRLLGATGQHCAGPPVG